MREKEFVPNPDYFTENYSPIVENALRYRSNNLLYSDIECIKEEMQEYVKSCGVQLVGKISTFVDSAVLENGKLGVEIIMPIDRPVPSYRYFKFVEKAKLAGCIMSKYQGFFLRPEAVYESLCEEAMQAISDDDLDYNA